MVMVPFFTYFFTLWEGIEAKIQWPKKFAPKLRKSCTQNLSSGCFMFYLFKTISHLTGHLNISITVLSIFLQTGWVCAVGKVGGVGVGAVGLGEGKMPWPGQ